MFESGYKEKDLINSDDFLSYFAYLLLLLFYLL